MTILWGIIIFCAGSIASTGLFWIFIRRQNDAHEKEITRLEKRMSVLGQIWGDERQTNDKAFR